MAERPIIFSGQMVRAILDGRKMQTRRVVTNMPPAPNADCHPAHVAAHSAPYFDAYCGAPKSPTNPRGMSGSWCWWQVDNRQCLPTIPCPYGVPGDRLWVRETWGYRPQFYEADAPCGGEGVYRADGDPDGCHGTHWRPSIHMPRAFSRLTLIVESVRVERLQDISEADAIAEGFAAFEDADEDHGGYAADRFAETWQNINYKRHPWESNPWVWVVTFMREEASRG